VGFDLFGTTMNYFRDFEHPLVSFDLKLPSKRWEAASRRPANPAAEEEMAEPQEEEEDGGWAAVGLPELSRGRRPSATARL